MGRATATAFDLWVNYLDYVHLVVGVGVAFPAAVLAELLPDELVVDEGGALEVRERQPRHEHELHRVPYGYPVEDRLGDHLQEGDEGVEDPVGQPLLVVEL